MLKDFLAQFKLSPRETEVVYLVCKGLSNKEIANQLFVTEKTVKMHTFKVYAKMDLKSRAQLIVKCLPHLGTLPSEQPKTFEQKIDSTVDTVLDLKTMGQFDTFLKSHSGAKQ